MQRSRVAVRGNTGSGRDENGHLVYVEQIHGMWGIACYANLLMGEIPRLTDDETGYGPKGKNYVVHVETPREVTDAFEELKKVYGGATREVNSLYASCDESSLCIL